MTNSHQEVRPCGSCHACCVHLGIEETAKPVGVPCRHLDTRKLTRRCSIYSARYKACTGYQCAWSLGVAGERDQPNKVGFLATIYEGTSTLTVFNERLAGPLTIGAQNASPLGRMLSDLLQISGDVKIQWLERGLVTWFTDGNIFEGKLLPGDDVEELKFEVGDQPVGRYLEVDLEESGRV